MRNYEDGKYRVTETEDTSIAFYSDDKYVFIDKGNDNPQIHITKHKKYSDIVVRYEPSYSTLPFGMPKCHDRKGSLDIPTHYQEPIERVKLDGILEKGVIPFCPPMSIASKTTNTDMIIYNSNDGMVCIKHTYGVTLTDDIYTRTDNHYSVVDYEDMINFMKECGLSLEIPKETALKCVKSRQYRGIGGTLRRIKNSVQSINFDRLN